MVHDARLVVKLDLFFFVARESFHSPDTLPLARRAQKLFTANLVKLWYVCGANGNLKFAEN